MPQINNNKVSFLAIVPEYHEPGGISAITQIGRNNALLMASTFRNISEAAGMQFEAHELSNIGTTEQTITDWINRVKQSKPRVAIIFYSGHGIQAPHAKWPRLNTLPYSPQTTSGKDIRGKLKATGVPLTLTIYDACNANPVEAAQEKHEIELNQKRYTKYCQDCQSDQELVQKFASKVYKKQASFSQGAYKRGAQALLQHATGSLGFTSSKRGETSMYYTTGSLGATLFAAALVKGCKKAEHATWQRVSESVEKYAKKSKLQTPVCSFLNE